MSEDALYRKLNDGSHSSSTYHKKDGTNARGILKEELRKAVEDADLWKKNVSDEQLAPENYVDLYLLTPVPDLDT